MKKLLIITGITALALSGCASTFKMPVFETTDIQTDIHFTQIIDTKSYEFKAFGSLTSYPNNEYAEALLFTADLIGYTPIEYIKGHGTIGGNKKSSSIRIQKHNAQSIITAIDKYLMWENKAVMAKDVFSKEIMRTTIAVDSPNSEHYKIGFHSGNPHSHYLTISYCTAYSLIGETCTLFEGYLDKQNALLLKGHVQDYIDGKIKQENTAAKYS